MGLRLVYTDVAVGAKEKSTYASNAAQSFVDLSELKDNGLVVPDYALLQDRYILLDGKSKSLPNNLADGTWGLISNAASGSENGNLPAAVTLTINTDALYSVMGLTFSFDTYNNVYCDSLKIDFYKDAALLASKTFTPDSAYYFAEQTVNHFNKIVITFYSLNKPNRFLWLRALYFGKIREFGQNEIKDLNILQEISENSTDLSINTVDFELVKKDDIEYMFQRKQPLEVYYNENILGRFFINGSKRNSKDQYTINAQDYVGLIDEVNFMGGMYFCTAGEIVNEIAAQCKVEILMDDELKQVALKGYLPICTGREALLQVAFAVCGIVDTSESTAIYIKKMQAAPHKVISDGSQEGKPCRIFAGATVESLDIVTSVELTSYLWTTSNEQMVAFEGDLPSGDSVIRFKEPLHSLTINKPTLVSANANYAVVNAGSGGTGYSLTGKKYNRTEKIMSKKNPDVGANDLENVLSISNFTLISDTNAGNVLNMLYEMSRKKEKVTADIIVNTEKVGDFVEINTEYGTKSGILVSLDYNVNVNRIAKAVILCG